MHKVELSEKHIDSSVFEWMLQASYGILNHTEHHRYYLSHAMKMNYENFKLPDTTLHESWNEVLVLITVSLWAIIIFTQLFFLILIN